MEREFIDLTSNKTNSARDYHNFFNLSTMGITASMFNSNTSRRHPAQAPAPMNFDDYCLPPTHALRTPRRWTNRRARPFRSRTPVRRVQEEVEVPLERSTRPPRLVSPPNPVSDFTDFSDSASSEDVSVQVPPLPTFMDLYGPARLTNQRPISNRISQLRCQIRSGGGRSAHRQICNHLQYLNTLPIIDYNNLDYNNLDYDLDYDNSNYSSSRSSFDEEFEVISVPSLPKRRARDSANSSIAGDLNASTSGAPPDILRCPVCMESSHIRKPTTTPCGHIFCKRCITQAARLTQKCPLCNAKIKEKNLVRLFV